MLTEIEFKEFPKIARLSREAIVTEKIDGTNACVYIGENGEFLTGSRTQWITPEKDNYGFSKWAHDNKEMLLRLGPGTHFGEWWGQGIQRKYGLSEKRFSLFNVTRWCLANEEPKQIPCNDPRIVKFQEMLPEGLFLVPVLYRGIFERIDTDLILDDLARNGSKAAPGFMKPEGIVVFHVVGNVGFKKTIENDDLPKSMSPNPQERAYKP